MPKEPRRVPTVLGRVQNGPVARPSGSVVPSFLSLRCKPLHIHNHFRSFCSWRWRFGAQVGLSAEYSHFVASLQEAISTQPSAFSPKTSSDKHKVHFLLLI